MRFGALRRRLEGISQKVLTDKLGDLEAGGLLARTAVEKPLAVHDEVTPLGRTLLEPLTPLRQWGQDHCDERTAADPAVVPSLRSTASAPGGQA